MDSSYRSGVWRALLSPVNTGIIIINVLVFVYMLLFGDIGNLQYMYTHGANFWPDVFENHEFYRLLSCAFIHFDLQHIFNNMLVLAFVGDNLERALGKVKYLILYLAAAVCASLASDVWFMVKGSYGISGGASGAVFGVVGALLVIVIRNRGRLEDISSRQLMLFAGFSIYHGVTSAGIDNAAHLGGFLAGMLLGLLLYRKKRRIY
jgi:rhomboid protease GluP